MVAVGLNFLFPLDQTGNPTPEALSLYWPHLESLTLKALSMCLPSGVNGYSITKMRKDLPDPSTISGFAIFENHLMIEEMEYFRGMMRIEDFHRLYSSVGYAAQRMPRLKTINISMVEPPDTEVEFTNGRGAADGLIGSKRPTLSFNSQSGYIPDERVAAAWGFSLDDLEVEDLGEDDAFHQVYVRVALDRFPEN
ncbi:uncharacterized protein BDW70DRAFT_164862 [Aspergillus foveolatus]|uniref:uncharacterized protein n=1 Tax=Aspergillus foveolatus TaxID=210207 RepID=UPI003CCD1439